jgi:hypothetical protein
MPEMAYGALFPCADDANTPLKKALESSGRAIHVQLPAALNKALELREKLLDRVQIL